eukprot:365777-Chlamydomonas_euryale.AAC.3
MRPAQQRRSHAPSPAAPQPCGRCHVAGARTTHAREPPPGSRLARSNHSTSRALVRHVGASWSAHLRLTPCTRRVLRRPWPRKTGGPAPSASWACTLSQLGLHPQPRLSHEYLRRTLQQHASNPCSRWRHGGLERRTHFWTPAAARWKHRLRAGQEHPFSRETAFLRVEIG